jgi:hypothetical protein
MAKKPTHLRLVGREQPLTGKQEAFAKLVASGSMLSDAYRECYSADNMKNSTLWSEACRLAQNPKHEATQARGMGFEITARGSGIS